jgi:hypothetical protein
MVALLMFSAAVVLEAVCGLTAGFMCACAADIEYAIHPARAGWLVYSRRMQSPEHEVDPLHVYSCSTAAPNAAVSPASMLPDTLLVAYMRFASQYGMYKCMYSV